MIIKNCENCSKIINTFPSRIEKGEGRFCSVSCSLKFQWKNKIRVTSGMKGKVAWNKGITMENIRGENHGNWKGEFAGYHAKHKWIQSIMGSPNECSRCNTKEAKRYEWANRSRKYFRIIDDWERLCVNCHRKDGYLHGEYGEPWNKDKKGVMPIPWNKGLKLKGAV